MKIRFKILIYLVITSLFSCNQGSIEVSTSPIYKANFAEHIKLSNYFQKMEYIFLDESQDGLFMNADVIEYFDNHWYILDEELRTILCFTKDGSFKFRIHAVGKGPGEYQLPTSMFIHEKNREIWVQCKMSRKILRYDLNGNFVASVSMGRSGIDMVQFNDSKIITFDQDYHYFSQHDSTYPGLVLVENEFKARKQLFEIKYDILLNDLHNHRCLSMLNDTCFFTYASDSIWFFTQNNQRGVVGTLDFGEYHLPDKIRSLPRRYNNYDKLLESGKVLWKDYFIPQANFFYMTIGLQNSFWYGIINRKTNEFIVSQSFVNDIQTEPFVFPTARLSEDVLVGFISADYTLALMESLERLEKGSQSERTDELRKFAELALQKSGNILVKLTVVKT